MSSVPPELAGLLERPVAVYRVYCHVAGSVDGGVLLGQLVFWSTRPAARKRSGWASHEAVCIERQTGVSPNTQALVRSHLRALGVIEERRTVGGRVAFRVMLTRLAELVRAASNETNDDDDAGCGCKEPGLAVRAAEVAAKKSETQKPESRKSDSGIQQPQVPESENASFQNPRDAESHISETTPEITSETTFISGALRAPKTTPAEDAGGGTDPALELETDPVLAGVVGSLVEAVRHGPPVNDLRALVVTALKTRGFTLAGSRIAAVMAAVNARAPIRRREANS